MTCIAGLIDKNGKGYIASDSVGSNGHNKSVYKNKKIFKKGNLLIGYTTSYRMGQLLEHNLTIPERKVGQLLDNYMYVDFVNAVRALFRDNGYLKVDNNTESGGTFLIITEGRIFKMEDDLCLLETSDNFDAVGSGQNFAQATLYILNKYTKLTPEKQLTEAIECASRYIATVGGEVRFLSDVSTEDRN